MNPGAKKSTGIKSEVPDNFSLSEEVSADQVPALSDNSELQNIELGSLLVNPSNDLQEEHDTDSLNIADLIETEDNDSDDVFFHKDQTIFKFLTKVFIGRSIFYFLLFVLVSFVPYTNKVNYATSLALVFVLLTGNYFLLKLSSLPDVLLRYIMFSVTVIDMGICTFLIFLNGSSNNLLILSYPLLICSYSISSVKLDFIILFILNLLTFWIASITFDTHGIIFFEFKTGFLIYSGLLVWVFSFQHFVKWLKNDHMFRRAAFGFLEKIIDGLPYEIKNKLESIMSSEKFRILEFEFRKKIEEIRQSLYAKDQELKFFKETLQSSIKSDDPDSMDSAVNQVNSLLEVENLSLKENNKKLMELNKTMEERVRSLSAELEIANTELERIYTSLNESKSMEEASEGNP